MGIPKDGGNGLGAVLSKIATDGRHGEDSPYFDGWKAYEENPFHPAQNPDGVIQMGLSENGLCFDLTEDWMKSNPKASICTAEGVENFSSIANFQDYHGLPEFRQAIARFMTRIRCGRAKFDSDRIVMSGGCTGACETLVFCLADPEDAFLVPSPYYPAFNRDVRWRTGVQLIPINCKSSNNFQLTLPELESAYEEAVESGVNVKGLILTNPSNPLGTTLDRTSLRELLEFTSRKKIHLVCDEIYSATVFSSPEFTSVSEVMHEVECCDPNLVHIIYSLSKDMGLPGFRVGVIYSYNNTVVSIARKMSSFGLVSSQTQLLVASMLSDEEFVEKFLEESPRRLRARHRKFVRALGEVGIGCLQGNAGLFFWMDLRHFLKEQTFEEEMRLWRVIVHDVRLNVSPGSSFGCPEPGFFRVCFANMEEGTADVALGRIRAFVSKREHDGEKKRKWGGNKMLRLSLKPLRYDENNILTTMSSPDMMSPRSPLVRARN
ncbi:hypothetical protein MLD38_036365 [Melastoma candidum]|uniref:Uncharacterized protein n=1 Tax=Melastoma candidum TaxID=119954 RepID=A0ACB9LJF0_9MYRT|nr:hypothetical protein MLD38_036365 [Melastoma candidum]